MTYDPKPWLAALHKIKALDAFPDFKDWLTQGLLNGYGISEREPWPELAAQGYY
ncbi:MAG: hypothetical protein AAF512_09665 [Pseudomonadota bacterium]